MDWIKRSLRAFRAPSSSIRPRARLAFDALEDRTVPTAGGAISGAVFFDPDGNSFNDGPSAGNYSMPGVTVTLSGTTKLGNAVDAVTITDAAGNFQFEKLEPGAYTVSANSPVFNSAVANLGSLGGAAVGSQVQTIILGIGQVENNLRFGLPSLAPNPLRLSLREFLNDNIGRPERAFGEAFSNPGSGRVVIDGTNDPVDDNDNVVPITGTASLAGTVRDANNAPLAGIEVTLSGVLRFGNPVIRTTTTDAAGNYSFTNLHDATYFINVVPSAEFRGAGSVVGSLGGSSVRADQLAPTYLDVGKSGTGYDFVLARFSGELDAGLANDVGNGSLGTSADGLTSDPSIRGRLLNPSQNATLVARFTAGATTNFVSIKGHLAVDGSFVLNPQAIRDIFGGGLPDGTYTVQIQATSLSGAVLTKSVSFTLQSRGPEFLNSFKNISVAASAANTTLLLAGAFTDPDIANSVVTFKILKGTTPVEMSLELFDKDAPLTVANFFNYFDRYDDNGGVLFHRLFLESGLRVLQGGGFTFNDATDTINPHITQDPAIRNEYSEDRRNERGTIAMAKTSDPDSATSEFFFNLDDVNATTLNVNNPAPAGGSGGFTVFGRVASDADLAVLDDLASTTVVNALGQATLPVVGGGTPNETKMLRITEVVTVDRDNELTYSVSSSNPAVVTAAVAGFQGNQLTLDYLTAGSSTITVTATDSTGNTATTTFVVTVT